MKKSILPFILILFTVSCNNSADNTKEAEIDSVDMPMIRMLWQAGLNDSTGNLEMVQVPTEDAGAANDADMISYLNETNPQIQLSHVKTSGDTIYLHIADAEYLTQRMGSSGPVSYLATVVYNLTDLPGVNFVNIDFEEGDHASPGTFTRETFRN